MEDRNQAACLIHADLAMNDLAFEDVLTLAAHVCGAPIAVLRIHGTDRSQISNLAEVRFNLNEASHLPFEYKVPLYDSEHIVGTISVYDFYPRQLNTEQLFSLQSLAKIASSRLRAKVEAIELKANSESALEKQNEFLNVVLDSLSDGIVACNEVGELTVFNRATKEFHGLDSANIPAEKWSEYYQLFRADGVTPMKLEEIPLRRAFTEGVVKGEKMVVIESGTKRRRELECNGRSLVSKSGRKLGAVLAMTDMTAVNAARAEKESSAKMLQSLIDSCPLGITVFDKNGRIVLWNPGSEKIFGWKAEEVVNATIPYTLEDHREEMRLSLNEAMKTRQKVEISAERLTKFGKKIAIQISLLPLFNDQNEVYGCMGVVIDVSDIKERETKLLEANRALEAASVAKSEFLANMSHEIRTPLNGVLGMTELMLTEERTASQDDKLRIISSSTQSLITIISDILDFSKIEAGKLELERLDFNFDSLIDESYEVLRTLADGKGITLVKKSPHNKSKTFVGDPGRLRQILVNLVGNAIKFSEGGEVKTRLEISDSDSGRKRVRVEVEDMGIGIHPDALAHLFKAFSQADSSTTRRFGGTGLGLSISKRLVSLMNGKMGVESELGSGSMFWFEVDLDEVCSLGFSHSFPINAKPTPAEPKATRILVVEDNPINQKVALGLLAKLGYSADIASNGKLAIEAVASNSYDIVLMDCQMPVMDGYQATKAIRSSDHHPDVTIIALTANSMKGDREKCLNAGMNDYLAKPLGLASLKSVLEKHVA